MFLLETCVNQPVPEKHKSTMLMNYLMKNIFIDTFNIVCDIYVYSYVYLNCKFNLKNHGTYIIVRNFPLITIHRYIGFPISRATESHVAVNKDSPIGPNLD